MKLKIFLFLVIISMFDLSAESPKILAKNKIISDVISKFWTDVEVIWEDYRLYADYVEVNSKKKEIFAKGRVTIASNDTVLSGEKLKFNYEKMKGEMIDTYGLMQPSIRYRTDKWAQLDTNTQKFENMEFTSCSQCVPRWKITCTNGKIKKEKYIEMKNVVFKVKNIPIFYLPFLRYPIKKDGRATGFLFPLISPFSDRLGFSLKNSFYWDIKPNIDLTLSLDYYKKAGTGIAEDFRYLFNNMNGNIKFYYFKHSLNYQEENNLETEAKKLNILKTYSKSDYIFKMEHAQRINFLNTEIRINIDRQSNPSLLRLHKKDFESIKIRQYMSTINLTSSLSNIRLNLVFSQRDTFYTEQNTSRTFKYLPSLTLNLNQQKIGKIPGNFSIYTSFQKIEKSGKRYEENEEESAYIEIAKTSRFSLIPSYNLKFINFNWLDISLNLESRNTFYPQSIDPESNEVVGDNLHLGYQTAVLTLNGPTFYKIFNLKKSKIKHLIEPQIKIRYVTKVREEERERLLSVDRFDYPSYSYVGFSLNTRLKQKSKNLGDFPRDILSYTISQNYYFDSEIANFGRTINDKSPEFSDLVNSLKFSLIKDFILNVNLSYNYYIKKFSLINVRMSYQNMDSFLKGSISFRSLLNPFNTDPDYFRNRSIIRSDISFDLSDFPIKLRSGIDYDITEKKLTYGSIIATYDYQCIEFNFKFRVYSYYDSLQYEFTFGFNLGNLGKVKNFLGFDR